MSKFILVLLLLSSTASAQDSWRTSDTYREAVYLGLHEIDRRQTLSFIGHKEELNPILGKSPTAEQVNIYFAATALAHIGIAYALPANYRKNFQYITIGVAALNDLRNYYFVGARIPI